MGKPGRNRTRKPSAAAIGNDAAAGYLHIQRGPWSALLLTFGAVLLAATWFTRFERPMLVIGPLVGGVMLILAPAFQRLETRGEVERLEVRFGPLPLFRTSVRYEDIRQVEVGRTLFLDGWGIHASLRGGWVWNIWGRDCVVIQQDWGVLRVGTDDATNLARFLKGRIGSVPARTPGASS